jgi:hypothetical protein
MIFMRKINVGILITIPAIKSDIFLHFILRGLNAGNVTKINYFF